MPAPSSEGPNRCPQGETGVEEDFCCPAWICARAAFQLALECGGIDSYDWEDGIYPPDLRSILAFEV